MKRIIYTFTVLIILLLVASCGNYWSDMQNDTPSETEIESSKPEESTTSKRETKSSTTSTDEPKTSKSKNIIKLDKNKGVEAIKTVIDFVADGNKEYAKSYNYAVSDDYGWGYECPAYHGMNMGVEEYRDHFIFWGGISEDKSYYIINEIERFYSDGILEKTIAVQDFAINIKTGEIVLERGHDDENGEWVPWNEDFPHAAYKVVWE